MNKQTATYNASDVYEAFVEKLLKENPDYWVTYRQIRTPTVWKRGPNNTVVEVMSQKRWLRIVNVYFLMGRKKVIAGERFILGHRLGAIQARTIARNFNNKQINWSETRKQPFTIDPVTGRRKWSKIIYHMSETYCRIAWEQLRCLENETYYMFKPSKGNGSGKGFSKEFSMALKANPLLATKYKQFNHELSID